MAIAVDSESEGSSLSSFYSSFIEKSSEVRVKTFPYINRNSLKFILLFIGHKFRELFRKAYNSHTTQPWIRDFRINK